MFTLLGITVLLMDTAHLSAGLLPRNIWPNPTLELDSNGDGTPDFWNKGGSDTTIDAWTSALSVSPTSPTPGWPNADTAAPYGSGNVVLTPSGGTGCQYLYGLGLPPGMYLTYSSYCSTWYLGGQPRTAGTYPISINGYDALGVSTNIVNGTLVVVSTAAPTITSLGTHPGGAVGFFYSSGLASAGGGSQYPTGFLYQWSVNPALPSGLSLSPSGAYVYIVGTPSAVSPLTTYTLTVSDSLGHTNASPFTFTLQIEATGPILDQMAPGGDVGIPYSYQFTSTLGGTAPFTWGLVYYCGGYNAMPPGLTLSAGGVLSGTPTTVGSYIFCADVTDNLGVFNSGPVTIAIAPATLTITAPPAAPHVGQAYSGLFTVTGGTNPYHWALASGSLPPGLTFDKFGHLTGTPTTAGAYTFTVQVTDLAGSTASATATLTIT